jgi:hypothetical protein
MALIQPGKETESYKQQMRRREGRSQMRSTRKEKEESRQERREALAH